MKETTILFIIICSVCACRQTGNKANADVADKSDTTKFFQVKQYIQNQIAEANKTPYYIYKITVANGKRDSTPINNAIFNQMATQFLEPDINDNILKKLYTENIFHDQTTKSFTISYTATDKQLEIQNIEVLLNEDGETVKRVFIRKFHHYADSSAIEQLSWKPMQSFQIYRLVQKPGDEENIYQTNIVWNERN